jgi:hypothetical protein
MECASPVERGFSPLDEALELVGGELSPWLVEATVRLGSCMPFEQVPELLAFFAGVVVSVETVRRWTERGGAALVATETAAVERLEREQPEAPRGPAVQQLSADGAMVPLVGGEWAEVKTVAIGRVEPAGTGAEAAVHSRDLSYFSRLADHERFARQAWGELYRRGTPTAGVVVGVMDGSEWLQGFLDLHRPDAVRVLDFPHAVEHLAVAAQAAFGPGTAATSTWLEEQRHTLRHGNPADVLAALRALPAGEAPNPVAAATARAATLAYLEKRWAQIQYAAFAACGYPIGSGMVESANKLVVEARLKGSGMHWARDNVDPMLALRAAICSQRWSAVWPLLWQELRRKRTERRRRRPVAAASVVAPGLLPIAADTAPALPSAPEPVLPTRRTPSIVDGKPTFRHPWKRGLLASTQRRPAAKT